jgi:hypothetical protein
MCFVRISEQTATFAFCLGFYNRRGEFTARYALSPYIKQIRFVFKGLKKLQITHSIKQSIKVKTIMPSVPENAARIEMQRL